MPRVMRMQWTALVFALLASSVVAQEPKLEGIEKARICAAIEDLKIILLYDSIVNPNDPLKKSRDKALKQLEAMEKMKRQGRIHIVEDNHPELFDGGLWGNARTRPGEFTGPASNRKSIRKKEIGKDDKKERTYIDQDVADVGNNQPHSPEDRILLGMVLIHEGGRVLSEDCSKFMLDATLPPAQAIEDVKNAIKTQENNKETHQIDIDVAKIVNRTAPVLGGVNEAAWKAAADKMAANAKKHLDRLCKKLDASKKTLKALGG